MKKIRQFFLLTGVALTFLGMGGLGCTLGDAPGSSSSSDTGLVYVADDSTDSIYVLENISTLSGTVTPVRTLNGDTTEIVRPTAVAVDSKNDLLYVSDTTEQNILVFVRASEKDGDVAPGRRFAGLKKAGALYYDSSHDDLYASDLLDDAIKVWDNASSLSDGANPTRTFSLEYTPAGFIYDPQRDLLYVSDPSQFAILVYTETSTATTIPDPARTIKNETREFITLDSLTMNTANDILFVAESENPSIEIFDGFSKLTGVSPADRELEGGSTVLSNKTRQILFNSNRFYAILGDSNFGIWSSNLSQLEGDTAPDQNVTVSGAVNVVGLAVDTVH